MDGWTRMHDDARAKLGQANRKRPAVGRMHHAMALRSLNAVRAGMRANERSVTRLQAELLALGMSRRAGALKAPAGARSSRSGADTTATICPARRPSSEKLSQTGQEQAFPP